jgi:hypothetical protein
MADFYATTYPDPTKAQRMVDEKAARMRISPIDITTTSAVLAISDRLLLCRIPSNARLIDVGQVSYSAFGGTAAINLGFDHSKMTAAERTAAASKLWAAQSIAAAASRKVMFAQVLADLSKRVWQVAGLASDPGGEIDIVATVTTATVSVGTIHGEVTFTTD